MCLVLMIVWQEFLIKEPSLPALKICHLKKKSSTESEVCQLQILNELYSWEIQSNKLCDCGLRPDKGISRLWERSSVSQRWGIQWRWNLVSDRDLRKHRFRFSVTLQGLPRGRSIFTTRILKDYLVMTSVSVTWFMKDCSTVGPVGRSWSYPHIELLIGKKGLCNPGPQGTPTDRTVLCDLTLQRATQGIKVPGSLRRTSRLKQHCNWDSMLPFHSLFFKSTPPLIPSINSVGCHHPPYLS